MKLGFGLPTGPADNLYGSHGSMKLVCKKTKLYVRKYKAKQTAAFLFTVVECNRIKIIEKQFYVVPSDSTFAH